MVYMVLYRLLLLTATHIHILYSASAFGHLCYFRFSSNVAVMFLNVDDAFAVADLGISVNEAYIHKQSAVKLVYCIVLIAFRCTLQSYLLLRLKSLDIRYILGNNC